MLQSGCRCLSVSLQFTLRTFHLFSIPALPPPSLPWSSSQTIIFNSTFHLTFANGCPALQCLAVFNVKIFLSDWRHQEAGADSRRYPSDVRIFTTACKISLWLLYFWKGNCTRELSRWWQESDMYAVFQYGDVKDLVTKVEWQLSNSAYTCCKWPWLSYINEAMKQQKFQLYYKSKFIFLHLSGKALSVHFTVWKYLLNERYKTFLSWSVVWYKVQIRKRPYKKSERRIHVIIHSWG